MEAIEKVTRSESEKLYELSGSDALIWLEKAQGLRYCAGILKDELVEMVKLSAPTSRRIETLGVVNSATLLLGLAFENLIKGVYVARKPSIVNRKKLDRSFWQSDNGHGIKTFAKTLITLDQTEEELLDRLQESIVWAGRFPIPTSADRYHQNLSPVNKHRFSTADFDVADRLFEKLSEQLLRSRSSQITAP